MKQSGPLSIIYDGACPFCSAYVKMLRLRQTFGEVKLINARVADPKFQAQGIQFDQGIVVQWQGQLLQGDAALHFLALASTPSSFWNKLHIALFRSARVSKLLYPLLYTLRNLALRILGRKRMSSF